MATRAPTLVWMDLEMTGLDPVSDVILQLAMILTDTELNPLCPALELTIWQPASVLEKMGPFVRKMHTDNGLLAAVAQSNVGIDDAQRTVMNVLTEHVPYRNGILCGNSVWQDRRFLERYMPTIVEYLHYRQVDVSTVKLLASHWQGIAYDKPDSGRHTALFDIEQSIEELRFFRNNAFKPKVAP